MRAKWTPEDHALVSTRCQFGYRDLEACEKHDLTNPSSKLLVAIIRTGNPKLDINKIAVAMNNGAIKSLPVRPHDTTLTDMDQL